MLPQNRPVNSYYLPYCSYSFPLETFSVHPNPGPATISPCGICERPVIWSNQGVCCDQCDMWHHRSCIEMCTTSTRSIVQMFNGAAENVKHLTSHLLPSEVMRLHGVIMTQSESKCCADSSVCPTHVCICRHKNVRTSKIL